jgi:mono/diheme cytochrome c family protein
MTEAFIPSGTELRRPRSSRRGNIIKLALLSACFATVTVLAKLAIEGPSIPAHFADAGDNSNVRLGKELYIQRCASCHGRNLQGQPLWQVKDQYFGRRAPALDLTGRTWQHADEDLFNMTKYGRFSESTEAEHTAMPAFRDVLGDHEILAVIAFIKARWPIGQRVLQAMRNPGQAGMPAGQTRADWVFSPDCRAPSQPAN